MSYVLYSAQPCPFAERVHALLLELDEPFEVREIDLDARDPEFLALTPTGKVPLLVDGDFSLYESDVICEYLAEEHRWGRAFDTTARVRARQRLAMKQWDAVVLPAWWASLRDAEALGEWRERVEGELDRLAAVVEDSGADPRCLLALHVAPFWARMVWTRKLSTLVRLVEKRGDLVRWLDATIGQEAVRSTLPDRAATVKRYEARYGAPGA
jgi:glutathione S-transferase